MSRRSGQKVPPVHPLAGAYTNDRPRATTFRSTFSWIVSLTCSVSSSTSVAVLGGLGPVARTGRSARRTRSASAREAGPDPTARAGEGRREREVRRTRQACEQLRLAQLRVDLLAADDGDRDDRRPRPQRDLDEAPAPEALQAIALGEVLAGALDPLGEDGDELILLEQPLGVVGRGHDAPELAEERIDTYGSWNAQLSTKKRG